MTTQETPLAQVERLCKVYYRRYHCYPTRIGIHPSHNLLKYDMSFSHETSSNWQERHRVSFFVDERATPEKMYYYNEQGQPVSSVFLNALKFVPLSMLPEAIQIHYRSKMA